jgi:uncharacterized membrane protein YoaK (UPF0700 family)
LPLLVEAALVATCALASMSCLPLSTSLAADAQLQAQLLCGAMGLQNALVTRMAGTDLRTTHVTGVVTEVAIELARLLKRCTWRDAAPPPSRGSTRLRLHLAVLTSFFAGTLAGAALSLAHGPLALAAPCIALVACAAFDVVCGFQQRLHVSTGALHGR